MKENEKDVITIDGLLEKNDYSEISLYFKEKYDLFKHYLRNYKLKELEKEIEKARTSLSYTVKKELVQKNVHFVIGRYVGFIEAINEYIAVEYQRKVLEDCVNSSDLSVIPHINDIILCIYKNEGIRHGKLAELVGIEKSTLTGLTDKLVKKGAITFSRPGKYKYYYLTELGVKYYKDNKNIIEAETDLNALTEQLLLVLSKEDDANAKLLLVLDKLFKGKNAFDKKQSKKQIDPTLIFARIPAINPMNVMLPDSKLQTVDGAVSLAADTDLSAVYLYNSNDINDNKIYSEFSELYIEQSL